MVDFLLPLFYFISREASEVVSFFVAPFVRLNQLGRLRTKGGLVVTDWGFRTFVTASNGSLHSTKLLDLVAVKSQLSALNVRQLRSRGKCAFSGTRQLIAF